MDFCQFDSWEIGFYGKRKYPSLCILGKGQNRRPMIILTMSRSVASVRPNLTPKMNSHSARSLNRLREKAGVAVFKMGRNPEGGQSYVIFDAPGDESGNVIADFEAGIEFKPPIGPSPFRERLRAGLKEMVPGAPPFIDNGADFHGPGIRREITLLIAEFSRQTEPDRPIPGFRDSNSRSDVVPNPSPAHPRLNACESIKGHFKPGGKPMGNFKGFMKGTLRRQNTIGLLGSTPDSHITVQLDLRLAGSNRFGGIYLNFIIFLSS